MKRVHAALLTVAIVATAATGYSYSTYAKWGSSPVTFFVNPANSDLSTSAAATATQSALNVWNTQGASPFRYAYGGSTTDTSTAHDGRNVVIFRNATSGSAIATTYSWWDGSNRLLDSDIIVWDGGFTFFTGTSGCGGTNGAYLEDILTHEFGHALGLNHSSSGDATMYPSYSYCSQAFRTLASDDVAGIQSLYGTSSSGGGGGSGGGGSSTTTAMSTPAPGATLSGSSQTFTWTAGTGVSEYWLYVGTTVGGNNLFNRSIGSALSATVSGLPTDGRTIYVRLYSLTSSWVYTDYTYTAAASSGSTASTNPAITTPSAGATLTGASQTFSWTAGSGVSGYWLYLGRNPGGKDLLDRSVGTSLSTSVSGLPTDGSKIYARLWWLRSGAWVYADTAYTASSGSGSGGTSGGGTGTSSSNPAIASPAPGTTLSGASQTFAWTAGTGATGYWLYLGSAVGRNDLFDRSVGTSLSVTATGLPTDGRTIYARLWWYRSGTWEYADFTYRAGT